MSTKIEASARKALHWLRDPTIHFIILGALIFAAHRLVAGDPRTVVITPALRADLERRFQDQFGREPNHSEIETLLRDWKREEALYREALRHQLDRGDAAVRALLVEKVRHREALLYAPPEPTPAELEQWLSQHRDRYEKPLVYEHEYALMARNEPDAGQRRDELERALNAGASPATLGLQTVAANLGRPRIQAKLGPTLADQICHLSVGKWHALEDAQRIMLVRVTRIEGGLPSPKDLHLRLIADWQSEKRQEALERSVQAIVDRYRFEEHDR